MLNRGISPEALEPASNGKQAGGCNIWAGWLVVGVLEIGVRAKPSLLLGRRLLGASAAQGGARQAACLERLWWRRVQAGHKRIRGSKKEKGPKPKGIKTRIWLGIYAALKAGPCPLCSILI